MSSRRFFSIPLLLCCSLSGCFLAAHSSGEAYQYYGGELRVSPKVQASSRQAARAYSPGDWQYGGGVRIAPGFPVGSSGALSAHPMASFTYLAFDGGSDRLLELGGQLRWRPSPQKKNGGFWIGAEANGARMSTSVSGGGGSASANGWALTGLVGAPVGSSKWGLNLFAGAGISDYGLSGKNVRAGVDLQPWFLKRSK